MADLADGSLYNNGGRCSRLCSYALADSESDFGDDENESPTSKRCAHKALVVWWQGAPIRWHLEGLPRGHQGRAPGRISHVVLALAGTA